MMGKHWVHDARVRELLGIGAALILCVSLTGIRTAFSAEEMVRVKVKAANLRSGPGTKHKKVWQAPRNYPYRVLKREGRWLKVRGFEGFEDWIYGPLTDRSPAAVVKVKTANVRSGPGTKYPVVIRADTGVAFQVLKTQGNWVKVRANDTDQGWVFKKLLWGFFEAPKTTARQRTKR